MELTEKVLKKLQMEQRKWFIGKNKKLKQNRPILNTIHFSKEGNVELTNSHVAIRLTNVHEETEHTIPDTDGASYPDLGRIFEGCQHGNIKLEFNPKELSNMLSPFKVAKAEVIRITFRKNGITIEPAYHSSDPVDDEQVMIDATLTIDLDIEEDFKIGVNTKYMLDAMNFFKTQKITTVKMIASSSVRPMLFEYENLQYLVTPVRIGA